MAVGVRILTLTLTTRACSHKSSASTPNCAARLGQIAPRSLRLIQPSRASLLRVRVRVRGRVRVRVRVRVTNPDPNPNLSATTTSQVGYWS